MAAARGSALYPILEKRYKYKVLGGVAYPLGLVCFEQFVVFVITSRCLMGIYLLWFPHGLGIVAVGRNKSALFFSYLIFFHSS